MTEKRYELQPNGNGQVDIVDWVESKEKNVICIYNDLGVPPYSSAPALCDLLNEQEERVKELKDENEELKQKVEDLEFALRTELAHQRIEKEKYSDTEYYFKKKLEKW